MIALTVSEALNEFLLSMPGVKSDDTIKWYTRRLRSLETYLGPERAIATIQVGDLRRWRADLEKRDRRWVDHPSRPAEAGGLSPWTIHGYVRAARIFFAWLLAEGVLERNPAERFELPKLPREPFKGLEEAKMQTLIEAGLLSSARDYAMLLFLADTCCRVGGLVGLTLSDLDLDQGTALVHEKGQEARIVYMKEKTVAALRDWLTQRPRVEHDYVFTNQKRGGPLTPSGVDHFLNKLAQSAGVSGQVSPHQWRHGGARAMLQRGAPLSVVAQILGHADIGTTWRFYAGLGTPQLKQAHHSYSWVS